MLLFFALTSSIFYPRLTITTYIAVVLVIWTLETFVRQSIAQLSANKSASEPPIVYLSLTFSPSLTRSLTLQARMTENPIGGERETVVTSNDLYHRYWSFIISSYLQIMLTVACIWAVYDWLILYEILVVIIQ